jgi:hypothetical protein
MSCILPVFTGFYLCCYVAVLSVQFVFYLFYQILKDSLIAVFMLFYQQIFLDKGGRDKRGAGKISRTAIPPISNYGITHAIYA